MEPTQQTLLDERAIEALCIRYATALDTRDWALLATCFTPDAVAEYEGLPSSEGYDAIEKLCRDTLTPLARSQHLLTNIHPEVAGDTATVSSYLQAQHVRPDAEGGPNFIIAGRYRDQLVRTADGWRLERRHLEIWWTEGNPAVVGG